jgi:hypothetical protein
MLEIILGIAGVWTLISGKVPGWIVGKKEFEIIGIKARLIGGILSLPLPISLAGRIILGILFGKDGVSYAFVFEIGLFITGLVIVMVLIRKFRTPMSTTIIQR